MRQTFSKIWDGTNSEKGIGHAQKQDPRLERAHVLAGVFFSDKENTMEVKIMVGKEEIMLRGGDKAYEICYPRNVKDKDTGEVTVQWSPESWYMSLPSVITAILDMKVRASDANSLLEVQNAIVQAKKELSGLYEIGA